MKTITASDIPPHPDARGVDVSTRAFEFSHGKKPKGYGSWAFKPARDRDDDRLVFVSAPGSMTYGEAKKTAQRHFAALGVDCVEACP